MEDNDLEFSGMKVLLVDDTPANVEVLRQTLEDWGLDIFVATNGEAALKVALGSTPDLILLDVMMPGIDGFETCRRLKSQASTREVPIIFITAKSETRDIIRGFSVGGVDYITKPFCDREVLARVGTHLRLQKTWREKKELVNFLSDANEGLVESQNQYRIIVETLSEIVMRLDADQNITSINTGFLKSLGYEEADIVGRPIRDFIVAERMQEMLPLLATRRFHFRATLNLETRFKKNSALASGGDETIPVFVDSFGIWNLPNNVVMKKGLEKKFLGTLCIGRTVG